MSKKVESMAIDRREKDDINNKEKKKEKEVNTSRNS